jgi:hypothetical protein
MLPLDPPVGCTNAGELLAQLADRENTIFILMRPCQSAIRDRAAAAWSKCICISIHHRHGQCDGLLRNPFASHTY